MNVNQLQAAEQSPHRKVINDWKISKKRHASYYGKIVVVPCPGDARVIKGKPSWMECAENEWFRTSPVRDWNRNSFDELVSVKTQSGHVYFMGTKYDRTKYKTQSAAPAVPIQDIATADPATAGQILTAMPDNVVVGHADKGGALQPSHSDPIQVPGASYSQPYEVASPFLQQMNVQGQANPFPQNLSKPLAKDESSLFEISPDQKMEFVVMPGGDQEVN